MANMKKYNPDIPLMSIHIPKCGGTSLKHILYNWFGENLFFHYFNEKKNQLPQKHSLKETLSGSYIRNACVHGHFNSKRNFGVDDYYPQVKQYITFLRDPLEVQLSLFHYNRKLAEQKSFYAAGKSLKAPSDIDEFLENSNSYIRYFFPSSLDLNKLDKYFVHIGVIELYQESIDILADKLNKPRLKVKHENQAKRKFTPSEAAMSRFKKKCTLEYKLYDKAYKANTINSW